MSLNRRDGYGVHDVGNGASAAQVIDRFVQTLENRAYGDGIGRALDRLVGIVAGVEVREDEDGGAACDLTPGQFHSCDIGIDGGIVLNGSLQHEFRSEVLRQPGCLPHLLDRCRSLERSPQN